MPVYLHHIETLLPENSYAQSEIATTLKNSIAKDDRRTARILHQLYAHSEIDRRSSVVTDFAPGAVAGAFYDPEEKQLRNPSTEARNALYTVAARQMFPEIARRVFSNTQDFQASELTHLITVSCTGFFQPGPDFAILETLGLHANVERYHLGFMGCYAAFPALRMAKAFCEANPDAVVLVVCLELCSLHVQWTTEMDDLLAGSVFADGAGAALVSARNPSGPALRLDGFASAIAPAGESDMAWTIGDTGFTMKLSAYVPKILHANVAGAIQPLLEKSGLTQDEVTRWAIHPGGRAILDCVEKGLGLSERDLQASRAILRRHGNMSSATILFVLKELMASPFRSGERALAMSFGPGLTVESMILAAA